MQPPVPGHHCLSSASLTLELFLCAFFPVSSLGMLPGSPAQAGSVLGSFPQLPTCWGAGLRQLDCRTGLPLNSISLGSLLYVRHRAVYTEGGDQLWGGTAGICCRKQSLALPALPKLPGPACPTHRCFAALQRELWEIRSFLTSVPARVRVMLMRPK